MNVYCLWIICQQWMLSKWLDARSASLVAQWSIAEGLCIFAGKNWKISRRIVFAPKENGRVVNDLRWITERRRQYLTVKLGQMWFYLREIEDTEEFLDMAEIFSDVCVELGVDWGEMLKAAGVYDRAVRFKKKGREET